ncbi:hypothetical protein ACNOYE_11335 [Nannocystaceae bacterium ST9]
MLVQIMTIQQFHRACVQSESSDPTLAALRRLREHRGGADLAQWVIWPASERDTTALAGWPEWVPALATATAAA